MSSANSTDRSPSASQPTVSRYDLQLAVVPVAFAFAALVGRILSLSASGTLALGSLIGLLVVLDALFLSPPGE